MSFVIPECYSLEMIACFPEQNLDLEYSISDSANWVIND